MSEEQNAEPEPTPLQWWKQLGETNPLAAARYYLANRRAINEERDALATQEHKNQ